MSNPKPYDFEASQDELELFHLREEAQNALPPVSEIAHIAALLAHGHPLDSQSAETYASQAISLWTSCHQKRKDWIESQAKSQLLRAKAEAKAKELPKPAKFPATYDDIAQLVLKIKKAGDRMQFLRAYARRSLESDDHFSVNYKKLPTLSESIEDRIPTRVAMLRGRKFNEDEYQSIARNFLDWHDRWKREKRASRGKSGAQGRWKKSPPEK